MVHALQVRSSNNSRSSGRIELTSDDEQRQVDADAGVW